MAERIVFSLGLVLAVAGLVVLILARSPQRESAPVDDESRRMFLNRAWLGALGVFGLVFGGASIALMWPRQRPGFGDVINAGKRADIVKRISSAEIVYNPTGRFYLVAYDTSDPDNRYVRAGVAADGLMAIFQKCSHLGCRVPFCPDSGWFECPCHDAYFNRAGELMGGVPPAGMWRFPVEVSPTGAVLVDTARPQAQPELGVDTLEQFPEGDHCVDGFTPHPIFQTR